MNQISDNFIKGHVCVCVCFVDLFKLQFEENGLDRFGILSRISINFNLSD